MENQALGLAEALQRLSPSEITVHRVTWRKVFDKLPSSLKAPWMLDPASDDPFPAPGEPWPDVWIATGRATLPLSLAAKRR
ncbi:MAG TPA: ELM1/GtrOC1 family putative glycosyltransferase, partial [Brevundimonas sp.]|nr:ELM1/GtrOC1 family putative glycosyltransferase [Brevundimonas sp.]